MYDTPYMWDLKRNDTNELIYKMETGSQTQKTNLPVARGKNEGKRLVRGVQDQHVHIAIFKVDNQQEPTIQHRELCSLLGGSLDGRGVWGRMDTWMCMTETLCCPPETITTLLTSYTSIENKKFFKREKNLLFS